MIFTCCSGSRRTGNPRTVEPASVVDLRVAMLPDDFYAP